MKRTLDIDLELEEAKLALERNANRLDHGRVIVTVERIAKVTTGYHVDIERDTTADIERTMQERPRRIDDYVGRR